ncbi:MAG: hypothetical protein A2Z16_14310 [Chloroflexi bacterium RBG_16_54_18]|nr:MAG: hypothetical protein A2Z16_14310 [Chloroflexi bacterium RBG_16_54_18]
MSQDVMLKEAIQAVHQGQRSRARDLITRLLRADQSNPEYWLWMSSLVDSFKEQVYCLQSALKLDPGNPAAKQGLVLLGAFPADPDISPVPPVLRRWEIPLQEIPRSRLQENPFLRLLVYSTLSLLVVGFMVLGAFGINMKRTSNLAFIPTRTPGPSPTYTSTPTVSNFTPLSPTNTPRITGAPPLWTLLDVTYTPTSIYISTPHPINEAFRVGQLALSRNNLDVALENLQQAILIEPESADILYAIGEIHRLQGEPIKALSAYEGAVEIDSDFAPAYLGRARLMRQLDPKAEVREDLELAIELDRGFGEALLELTDYLFEKEEVELALEYLGAAVHVMPGSPLVHLYQAQAHLLQGELQQALEEARLSNQLDMTLLSSYKVLGQAAVLNEEYEEAFTALDTYLQYRDSDAEAWAIYGEALYASDQYSETIKALDIAIKLDPNLPDAFHIKGLAYIELGEGQKGVNEIYRAIRLKPNTFNYQLDFARALFVAERVEEAVGAMYPVERLAEDDEELAQVYFWRAVMLEAQGENYLALKDWRKLLELDEGTFPQDWLETAEARLIDTPTPGLTSTTSPTLTPSLSSTRTSPPQATGSPTPGS